MSSLEARRLAIVRELYLWREEAAASRNRPARTVLRDDLIVEIAKRGPKREDAISSLRGMGRARPGGILEAVERAGRLQPEELPEEAEHDNDPHAVALVSSLLNVVLADWCARQELTTPLVATSSDVRRLVRSAAKGEPPRRLRTHRRFGGKSMSYRSCGRFSTAAGRCGSNRSKATRRWSTATHASRAWASRERKRPEGVPGLERSRWHAPPVAYAPGSPSLASSSAGFAIRRNMSCSDGRVRSNRST